MSAWMIFSSFGTTACSITPHIVKYTKQPCLWTSILADQLRSILDKFNMERTMPHMIKYKETKKPCIMKKSKIIRIKYDQKEEIANRLSQLDNIALTKVVNYIKQKIPRAFLPIDKENS